MMAADRLAGVFGMVLEDIGDGFARLSMPVRAEMMNGLGVCHGGVIFSLADTAFAYACNSRNIKTVALTCSINYINPSIEGDTLIANAVEKSIKGRTGVYDISISKQDGTLVAEFRGTSYGTSSPVCAETDES